MKLMYEFFLLLLVSLLMASLVTLSCFGSELDSKLASDTSYGTHFSKTNQSDLESERNTSNLSSTLTTEQNKGLLFVKVTTINQEHGMNVSSDFTVNIHANDPVPDTFKGNASGTEVKLSMGMYSVTTSFIEHYNSSFSDECNGGIMKVETKNCNIVITYSKPQ
jgi:hypothetical protein